MVVAAGVRRPRAVLIRAVTTTPDASFVVPARNEEDYYGMTLASIGSQTTVRPYEVGVADGYSTDGARRPSPASLGYRTSVGVNRPDPVPRLRSVGPLRTSGGSQSAGPGHGGVQSA